MKRQHKITDSSGGSSENIQLITYVDCNVASGDHLIERVTNTDLYSTFGYKEDEATSGNKYVSVVDPTDSSRYCIKRSTSTKGSSTEGHGMVCLFLDTRVYQESTPSKFRYFVPALTSATNNSIDSSLLGLTAEFMWYPKASSRNAYIINQIDSFYANSTDSTSNDKYLLGNDLYRNGTNLYIKSRYYTTTWNFTTYTLGTFTVNRWYKWILKTVDNGNGTYSQQFILEDTDGNVLLDSNSLNLQPIHFGTSSTINKNNRASITIFNSNFGWSKNTPNTTDLMKEFKIYKEL